jgi:hypothetical protein
MILKFNKSLNEEKEYSLIEIDTKDSIVDLTNFSNCPIYETANHYYFYNDKMIDIENLTKFKIKAKKGDIVSLTARDNSYLVFPSKKTFSIAFNLKYTDVLQYKYVEVLFNGKPYQVKYVENKEDKVNDGVVYTLKQLCTYISSLIKGYNYRSLPNKVNDLDDKIKRVINKYYDLKSNFKFDRKYELNIRKVWQDDNGKWQSTEFINLTKSNMYMYDYYRLYMFAYMILAKSKKDKENENDPIYCFNESFETIDDVMKFLSENQDIVNNFFIETNLLFERPNSMYSSYAPHINGIYMFYEYDNIKTYVYRNVDRQYFKDKLLKRTYVSTKYKHKILGIKNIFTVENDY